MSGQDSQETEYILPNELSQRMFGSEDDFEKNNDDGSTNKTHGFEGDGDTSLDMERSEVFQPDQNHEFRESRGSIANSTNERKMSMYNNFQASDQPMPFACTLCCEKFAKKLLLSAHVEKRHGIKYVFTERGKKVKLVRMPESINEGDKFDPFVELLMKNAVGRRDEILVRPVEPNTSFAGVAEELKPEDLLYKMTQGIINCGVLVKNLSTGAAHVASSRGDIPFVAFAPYNNVCFLLRVVQLNAKEQILFPATLTYLKNLEIKNLPGVSKESGLKAEKEENQSFDVSKVAVVAYANVLLNKKKGQFEVVIRSPVKDRLNSARTIQFENFRNVVLLSKPKRLRLLSEAYTSIAACEAPPSTPPAVEKPKRRYSRRGCGNENNETQEEPHEKRRRNMRQLDTDEDKDSDNEKDDETYTPECEKRTKQVKRRGRPRKMKIEPSD